MKNVHCPVRSLYERSNISIDVPEMWIHLLLLCTLLGIWPATAKMHLRRTNRLFYALLVELRWIVLKEFRHGLLQVLVILVRIFLQFDCLASISAPDQLRFSRVIQVHYQRSDWDRRGLSVN